MEVKLRLRERLGIKLLMKHTLDSEFTPYNDGSDLGCLAIEVDDKWYKIIGKVAGMDAQKLFEKYALYTRYLEGREG
jgi:hypothetical protein